MLTPYPAHTRSYHVSSVTNQKIQLINSKNVAVKVCIIITMATSVCDRGIHEIFICSSFLLYRLNARQVSIEYY